MSEQSLFDRADYLEMYRTAASEPSFTILEALDSADRLSTSDLAARTGRSGNKLHYHLRTLRRTGLIRNYREPSTGTDEPYSYYELTSMGAVVLNEGVSSGIQKLMEEEQAIAERYGN